MPFQPPLLLIHDDVRKALTTLEEVVDPSAYLIQKLLPKFLATNEDVWSITVCNKVEVCFRRCCAVHPIFVGTSQEQLTKATLKYFSVEYGIEPDYPVDTSDGPVFMSPVQGQA